MKNYDYQKQLREVWEKAVQLYANGNRQPDSYFNQTEAEFIASIGVTAQEIYDFAEDYNSGGEPDFATFALIHDIRRSYFLDKQKGVHSSNTLDPATLPPKDSEARGIRWLPRIIEKAKAKLRGELHTDIMYSCGGDRAFLKENDIHASEFLRVVAENEDDEQKIIDWVANRSPVVANV